MKAVKQSHAHAPPQWRLQAPWISRSIVATGLVLVLFTVAACQGTSPSPSVAGLSSTGSLRGLSEDQAIAIARTYSVPPPSSPVVSTTAGPFRQFETAPGKGNPEPQDRMVWEVVFGAPDGSRTYVILDFETGAFIESGVASQ